MTAALAVVALVVASGRDVAATPQQGRAPAELALP
jgi:hypothetical protein